MAKLSSTLVWAICALPQFFSTISAQTPAVPSGLVVIANFDSARAFLAQAIDFFDAAQYQQAEEHAESAYNYLHQTPAIHRTELAEAAFRTGQAAFFLKKYTGCRPFLLEAAQIWKEEFPDGSLRTAEALHMAAVSFRTKGLADDALRCITEACALREKLLPPNHQDLAESLRIKGNIYLDLGQYAKAADAYSQAIDIEKVCSGPESTRLADVLCNQGMAMLRLGNYQQSIVVGEQALMIRQKTLPPDHLDLAESFSALGATCKALRQYDDALHYFERALDIRRKKLGDTSPIIAYMYSEIGQIHRAKRDFPKALEYFEKENDIMIQSNATSGSDYAYVCNDLGNIYFSLKNYPKAVEYHEKMVALFKKSYQYVNSPIASALVTLGSSLLANQEYDRALAIYQEAKQIWELVWGADAPILSRANGGIAYTYRKWYLATGDERMLEKSRQYFQLAEKGAAKMIQTETSAAAQKRFLGEAVPIFEKAIGIERLYRAKHDTENLPLETAWQMSESMHSYLLFSATQEANARQFAGIPGNLLAQDSSIRQETIVLEKKRRSLIQDQGRGLTDTAVMQLNALIFQKNEAMKLLQADFEKKYPRYFALKYDLKTVSIAQTRELLSPSQTLLEYFTGDSVIYVFAIQKNDSLLLEIPRDFPLNDWITGMQTGITGYHSAQTKSAGLYQKSVVEYAENAHKLYEKLVQPLANFLTPELIIIPGDELASVPFEALLSAAPKDVGNFGTYPFLIRNYAINYAYSATMWHQMSSERHSVAPKNQILAMAPFFDGDTLALTSRLAREDGTRLGLSPLPYSGEEVVRIKKRFGGHVEIITGKSATKEHFLNKLADYQILHLATHGKANHKAGEFSFLAFATDDGNAAHGLLSVGELYNCTFNADLVVLSACETGIGEEQRGEGVVSLARAFAFSGARSIVSSLWSVNDQSTMEVMDGFYAALKAGKAKNLALTIAKRQYLAEHPGLEAHPFFWAGFVAVGDMKPIR